MASFTYPNYQQLLYTPAALSVVNSEIKEKI